MKTKSTDPVEEKELSAEEKLLRRERARHKWTRSQTKMAAINMSLEVYERFKIAAAKEDKSFNKILNELLLEFLDSHGY